MATITLILVVTLFLLATAHYFERQQRILRFSRKHGCRPPPHESGYDILGIAKVFTVIDHFRRNSFLSYMHGLFKTHSKTYTSTILGQKIIFTSEPLNIKFMLSGAFPDYDSSRYRAPSFKPLAEHGLFAVDGKEWKEARNVFRSQFSNTAAIVNLDVQEYHLQKFMQCIPPDGSPIDVQEHFINLTQSIVTSFALGDSVEPENLDPEREKLFRNLRHIDKIIVQDGYLGTLRHLTNRKPFFKACNEVQRYVGGFVSQALAIQQEKEKVRGVEQKPANYSLVKGLTEHTQDFSIVRDTTSTVLEAGAASVASLLSSTFWLLARDERVIQKLRADISATIGHTRPTYEQLRRLPYLRDVLKEVLRCFPVTPLNIRVANTPTTLPTGGGPDGTSSIFVEKDQAVMFSLWSSHHDPEVFGEDAWAFRPERWEGLGAEPSGYFPFNFGPRVCPGQDFALVEVSYITIRLLQIFPVIKSQDSRDWTEGISVTLHNGNGVIIGFHDRIST